jgi:hypothetical protein
MEKYLVLWELEQSRLQVDVKERATMWKAFHGVLKQDFERGNLKEWGNFVGEHRGFSIVEGTPTEVGVLLQQYVPFVRFTVQRFVGQEEAEQVPTALLE